MGSSASIGMPPEAESCASMHVTITSVGGRVPPARHKLRPCAASHSHVQVQILPLDRLELLALVRRHAPTAADVPRHHPHPVAECLGGVADPLCDRPHNRPLRIMLALHLHHRPNCPLPVPPVNNDSVFPWTPFSQEMEPPGHPIRFKVSLSSSLDSLLSTIYTAVAAISRPYWLPTIVPPVTRQT